MKTPNNPHRWRIAIDDGFTTWQYELDALNYDVSIFDVAKKVARYLKATIALDACLKYRLAEKEQETR